MSSSHTTTRLSTGNLREEVKKEYAEVALNPYKGYHFHTGRAAADRIGYDPSIYAGVPEDNIAPFAGTGNPFSLGPINPGETVVDVGSGAGFDALIASKLVGPEGRVIGVDMTEEMLNRARAGAAAMGATQVEFFEGFAEDLPLADGYADVVISNGVLNLTPRLLKNTTSLRMFPTRPVPWSLVPWGLACERVDHCKRKEIAGKPLPRSIK